MTILDCEQNSPEWLQARMGLPTASEFSTILARGKDGGESKTRRTYMMKLAGEIVTGEPMENYSNGFMERGKEMEAEARDAYVFTTNAELTRVGFVTTTLIGTGSVGCSPDSLIGAGGGLEIKTAMAHIQIERLLRGELPAEHRAQVQGGMWVCEREWWDFVSYCPRLPLLIVRVQRDEDYIAKLAEAVAKFNDELTAMINKIRSYQRRPA